MIVFTTGFSLIFAYTISLAAVKNKSAENYSKEKPDARITLVLKPFALGIGYSWGSGTLIYNGKRYPFDVGGISIVSVGASQAEATGVVFNLKKRSDFNGTYTAVTAEGTLAFGGSAMTMKNQNGVAINLLATSKGLSFKLAPEGINIKLK